MKIQSLNSHYLRNDAHFQFITEVKDLIARIGAEELRIKPLFDSYLLLYAKVDDAYKKIVKSAITQQIQDADRARDEAWSGFCDVVSGYAKHYDPAAREAARKLLIVLGTYGNIARKPLNEQTSATYNILQEFEGKYAPDISEAGLRGWVLEIKRLNNAFGELMRSRYDEAASKNHTVLRDARLEIDSMYQTIVNAVNAFIVMHGASDYEAFANTLNEIIAKYRKRRRRKGSEDADSEEGESEEDAGLDLAEEA